MTKRTALQGGFTLIELMVTLVIAAVLMMVAVPSLTTYRRNAELTGITNTLVSAISLARGEAMKRGVSAMVVPTGNGSDWTTGWVVFVDLNSDKSFNAATDPVIATQNPTPSYISISGSAGAGGGTPAIIFDASGYSKNRLSGFGALTLSLSRNDGSAATDPSQIRRIIIASTGRTRVCRPATLTDPNCLPGSTL